MMMRNPKRNWWRILLPGVSLLAVAWRLSQESDLLGDVGSDATCRPSESEANSQPIATPTKLSLNQTTQYQWLGNQWIPPHGIPHYTLDKIRDTFGKHNTLFLGDSTMRRAYHTLFAILNATTSSSDLSIHSLDHVSVIDVNKRKTTETCHVQARNWAPSSARSKLWNATGGQYLCRQHRTKKFDLGSLACYKDIYKLIDTDMVRNFETLHEYSLIVVGVGLWDTIKGQKICQRSPRDGGPVQRLHRLWDWLALVPNEQVHVVWRTSGFHQTGIGHDLTWFLNDKAIAEYYAHQEDYRQQHNQRSNASLNMSVVDWGKAIYPRSLNDSRIEGDIPVHYGLQARLLFIQMLTYAIQ